jgi:hypothetical protein
MKWRSARRSTGSTGFVRRAAWRLVRWAATDRRSLLESIGVACAALLRGLVAELAERGLSPETVRLAAILHYVSAPSHRERCGLRRTCPGSSRGQSGNRARKPPGPRSRLWVVGCLCNQISSPDHPAWPSMHPRESFALAWLRAVLGPRATLTSHNFPSCSLPSMATQSRHLDQRAGQGFR